MSGGIKLLQAPCRGIALGAVCLFPPPLSRAGEPARDVFRDPPPVYGPATCSSTACHGGATEQGRQFVLWSQRDAHSKAYATLTTARAARMAEALGIASAMTSPRCTSCHAPLQTVEPAQLRADARSSDGVSCVSCHGLETGWLRSHTRADFSHGDRTAAGLRELRDLHARANACVACHQNIAPELVQVAKHPALLFELDGQTQAQPKHWREPEGRSGAQAWFVGQAVALREMSWALLHGMIDAPRERPRWAALHWLLRRTELPLGTASLGTAAPEPDGPALRRTMETADQLARRGAGEWDAGHAATLLARLAGTAAEFAAATPSRQEQACRAERLVLALDRLLAALPPERRPAVASQQLDRLFQLAQSQPDFQPAEFARELAALARAL